MYIWIWMYRKSLFSFYPRFILNIIVYFILTMPKFWPIGDSSSWLFLFLRFPIILWISPNWLAHDEGLSFLFSVESWNQSLSNTAWCLGLRNTYLEARYVVFYWNVNTSKFSQWPEVENVYIAYTLLSPLLPLTLFGSLSKFIQVLLILAQYTTKEDSPSLPHVPDGF